MKDLVRCLHSLRRQSVPSEEFEIVVVDDGSAAGVSDAASPFGARVIRQEKHGPAGARNRGVFEARGDIVAFIDADCDPDRDWLRKLTGPLLEDTTLAGTVGRCSSEQESVMARFVQFELDLRYARMAGRDRTDFVGSGNSAFRRQLLVDHPFDERYRRLEDVELSFRLAEGGHRMIYVPDARVLHRHPETLGIYLRRKFEYSRYAFSLYRRYPNKVTTDRSTPQSRRTGILLLGLAFLFLPLALVFPLAGLVSLGLVLTSLALSTPLSARAFRVSPRLGLAVPVFVLMGNLTFAIGSFWGLVRECSRRRSESSVPGPMAPRGDPGGGSTDPAAPGGIPEQPADERRITCGR